MVVVKTIKELKDLLNSFGENRKVGFVPTMGALHAGHVSLIERCVNENDVSVVSIFVNPTQFNDKKDLEKYPRTLDADCKLLEGKGVNIIFAPAVEEMYPEEDKRVFDFSPLDKVMEGKCRPGHFNGVAQIVSKLFDAVNPDRAYFGEKDFQQVAIIKEMVHQLRYDIEIKACPIKREDDGLALSSRNSLLSPEERSQAVNISKALFASKKYADTHTVDETKSYVESLIAESPLLKTEYFTIVDGDTLQDIKNWEDTDFAVGCIAVFCGNIRLIDNIKYKE